MAKYTLTVASDDLNDVVQCLTPALVTAAKGAEILGTAATEGFPQPTTETVEAKPVAKRGRKPKAEVHPEPEVVEQPVAEEKAEDDFADALADEPVVEEAVVTKQQVTDTAVEAGSKHGRDIMVAAITKFAPTGKLAGVAEGDYPKLFKVLTKLASLADKAAAKAFLETV